MKKSTRGASTAVSASLVYFYTTKKTSTTDVSQAGVTGFEPVFTVLETVALPLSHSPMFYNETYYRTKFDFSQQVSSS